GDLKRSGVRFKTENPGIGELAMKINNGGPDVTPDVDNGFRFETRRHVILCFRAAPEQNLIENKRISSARSIENILVRPTQVGQRCGWRSPQRVGSEAQRAGPDQYLNQVPETELRHDVKLATFGATRQVNSV